MSDITISYKGSSIATMDATGTKTLLTEGKYCEDDIEIAYVKPSGGGGLTLIASGESTLTTSNGRTTLTIGKKMAQTDFIFRISVDDGTEYPNNNAYVYAYLSAVCYSEYGYFDLSTSGDKQFISSFSIVDNNSGTKTTNAAGRLLYLMGYIRVGNIGTGVPSYFHILRTTEDNEEVFKLSIGNSNNNYKFLENTNYKYEIYYFGNNPSTDIVELS